MAAPTTRFFAEIAYLGTRYHGWQRQPGKTGVQEVLETALSTILQVPMAISGCGRTDTGVHAQQYFLHFDVVLNLPTDLVSRLNRMLPADIAVRSIQPVEPSCHARFSACLRTYQYHISFRKDPHRQGLSWWYNLPRRPKEDLLHQAATLFLRSAPFAPFCKTGHQLEDLTCQVSASNWSFFPAEEKAVFTISANRFLRGMVRLIVGAQILAATGKLALEDIESALIQQSPLARTFSVPAEGLTLSEVRYPWDEKKGTTSA